ncbi:hypothetical protein [Ectothiorhodospira shaposhnikovii]|uniref:hypothetical protein n=1 Tax=Ectothiorhodospira shaposhnikovii TaxID=1054 RepID=UPI001EE85E9E|nr:hypothetical protein [Ectothiorhodospira shaposhnikovii]MCG5512341.1 hypothetical protein [Ectothiorhodospira shaposhnikovii]
MNTDNQLFQGEPWIADLIAWIGTFSSEQTMHNLLTPPLYLVVEPPLSWFMLGFMFFVTPILVLYHIYKKDRTARLHGLKRQWGNEVLGLVFIYFVSCVAIIFFAATHGWKTVLDILLAISVIVLFLHWVSVGRVMFRLAPESLALWVGITILFFPMFGVIWDVLVRT